MNRWLVRLGTLLVAMLIGGAAGAVALLDAGAALRSLDGRLIPGAALGSSG